MVKDQAEFARFGYVMRSTLTKFVAFLYSATKIQEAILVRTVAFGNRKAAAAALLDWDQAAVDVDEDVAGNRSGKSSNRSWLKGCSGPNAFRTSLCGTRPMQSVPTPSATVPSKTYTPQSIRTATIESAAPR